MTIKEAIQFNSFIEAIFTSTGKNEVDILADKYPQMLKNTNELGKRGWVLFLLPKSIKEQLDSLSPNEFDRKMVAVYSLGSMNEDIKYIMQSAISDYRKTVFDQAFKAFQHSLYYPCYAAITSQIEGLMSDIGKEYIEGTGWFIKVTKMYADMGDIDYFDLLLYQSLKSFIEEFTHNNYKFDKDEPTYLNRNWVLHGRTTKEIAPIDCIKLIRAFYVYSYFYSLIKKE